MSARIAGKFPMNQIEMHDIEEHYTEKLKRKYLENVKELPGKSTMMCLLKVADFMTIVFPNKVWDSDIHRWHASLVLSAEVVYIVYTAYRDMTDYIRNVAKPGELARDLKMTWRVFGLCMYHIDSYGNNLDKVNKALSLAENRHDIFAKYLVENFDYYVHKILMEVELIHDKLRPIVAILKEMSAKLELNLFSIYKSGGGIRAMMEKVRSDNEAKLKTRKLMAKVPETLNVTCNGRVLSLKFFVERLQNQSFANRGFPE